MTRGPTLAPSISTSMPNSAKVFLMMKAFCWMLPASAGDCFLVSKSTDGSFQFGSVVAVRAEGSLMSSGLSSVVFLDLASFFGEASSVPEPELTLISS